MNLYIGPLFVSVFKQLPVHEFFTWHVYWPHSVILLFFAMFPRKSNYHVRMRHLEGKISDAGKLKLVPSKKNYQYTQIINPLCRSILTLTINKAQGFAHSSFLHIRRRYKTGRAIRSGAVKVYRCFLCCEGIISMAIHRFSWQTNS